MQAGLIPCTDHLALCILNGNAPIFRQASAAHLENAAANSVRQHRTGCYEISHKITINRPGIPVWSIYAGCRKAKAVLIKLNHMGSRVLIRRVHHQDSPWVDFLTGNGVLDVQNHIPTKSASNQ